METFRTPGRFSKEKQQGVGSEVEQKDQTILMGLSSIQGRPVMGDQTCPIFPRHREQIYLLTGLCRSREGDSRAH